VPPAGISRIARRVALVTASGSPSGHLVMPSLRGRRSYLPLSFISHRHALQVTS
jgi:hypothetical protein